MGRALAAEESKKAELPRPKVGSKVEAVYDGRGEYFPGKITAAHADGTFDILYDDGDREDRVPPGRVRLTGAEAEAATAAAAAAAAAATAAAAVVVPAPAAVPAAPAVAAAQPAMVKETRMTNLPGTWAVGARVQGNYGGKGEFFPGKVRN